MTRVDRLARLLAPTGTVLPAATAVEMSERRLRDLIQGLDCCSPTS
jgi:hypothetical protein